MFDSIRSMLHDALMADTRRRFKVDEQSDDKIQHLAVMVVQMLPTERLKTFVERQATSPRLGDRMKARQLAIVLFAQAELRRIDLEITPAEASELLREASEEMMTKSR